MHQQNLLVATAKGALAGLAGTAVMTVAMKNVPALLTQLGLNQNVPARQQPSGGIQPEEPTEKMARQVSEKVLHTPLQGDQKAIAGQALHWGYGAAWGALYGLTQSQLPGSLHVQGLLFGGLVGTVATTAIPALELAPAPTEQPPQDTAVNFTLHLLYGWVTAATYAMLTDSARSQIRHAREGQWAGPVETSSAGEWPATPTQGTVAWQQASFTPAGQQPERTATAGQRRQPQRGNRLQPTNEQRRTDNFDRAGIYYPTEALGNIPLPEMASWNPGASDHSRYTHPGGLASQHSTQQCRDVMTADPVCCVPDDSIERVAKIMRDEDTGVVPVIDAEVSRRLIGLVTDRDLVIRALATGSTTTSLTAEQVMTRDPVSCRPEDNIERALELMASHQLRRVPILADNDRLVGIIAQADIARQVERPMQVAEVVEEISQPA